MLQSLTQKLSQKKDQDPEYLADVSKTLNATQQHLETYTVRLVCYVV